MYILDIYVPGGRYRDTEIHEDTDGSAFVF